MEKYSSTQKEKNEFDLKQLENSIINIIDGPYVSIDPTHALLLARANGFQRGEKLLLEKLNADDLLINIYMKENDNQVISNKIYHMIILYIYSYITYI